MNVGWAQTRVGLKSHKPVYHYALNQWTTEDGLSSNNITQVFQSTDGYIWISSFNGLLRFDGVEFEHFNIDNLEFLNSNAFYGIYQGKNDILYFSTQASGILAYSDKTFKQYKNSGELTPSVRLVFEDSKRRMWLGSNNNGLYVTQKDTLKKVKHKYLEDITIFAITEGPSGRIFIGTSGNGIVTIKGDRVTKLEQTDGLSSNIIKCFKWVGDALFIGTVDGIFILEEGIIRPYGFLLGIEINAIEVDKSGALWFATETGLGRAMEGKFEFFTESEGLPSRQISSLMFDTEENLWLSTKKSGLLRLKYSNFTNITKDDGLSINRVNTFLEEKDGVYLIGTDNGNVDRISGNKVTRIEFQSQLENISIKDLLIDQKGVMWAATYAGVIKKTVTTEILYTINDECQIYKHGYCMKITRGKFGLDLRTED